MSRTFHHGDRKKEKLYGEMQDPWNNYWHWMRSAPKWFSKMTRHCPQRAKRTLAEKEVLITDLEDMGEVEWPGDKKPQEYYW